jgi:hypothetical protein
MHGTPTPRRTILGPWPPRQVFRDAAAVYDGEVLSIPYSAEVPLLFWRK